MSKLHPRYCPRCNHDLKDNTTDQCPVCGHTYQPLKFDLIDAPIQHKQSTKPCPHCNYDLRANTTDQCPECGNTYHPQDLNHSGPTFISRSLIRLLLILILLPIISLADMIAIEATGIIYSYPLVTILAIGFWIKTTYTYAQQLAQQITKSPGLADSDQGTIALSIVYTILLCASQAMLLFFALFGACLCIGNSLHP